MANPRIFEVHAIRKMMADLWRLPSETSTTTFTKRMIPPLRISKNCLTLQTKSMTTMKNATSTEAPNLTLDQFPKVCHSAMRRIQSVVEQERPKHVVCWGPMHPWVYAALSVMDGGRIDAIYQAKEFKEGDMVVVQDLLLTNVKRNQARSPLDLAPTSLEVHVRDRAEEVVLHDDTFRWGRADMLIFSQHLKSKVPFHEIFKTRRPDWTFNNVLCVIPNSLFMM